MAESGVTLDECDELDHPTAAAVRALLAAAFEGEFADQDWDHCLGGAHLLLRDGAWDGDVLSAGAESAGARSAGSGSPAAVGSPAAAGSPAESPGLIGHAAVVPRRLLHAGKDLRCGYVEGVAVRADRQCRGLGARLMDAAEQVIRRHYDLGALSSTDAAFGFYAARGWQLWRGPSSVLTPDGAPHPTPDDDGAIFVLPLAVPLDLDGLLTCDWRDGDVW